MARYRVDNKFLSEEEYAKHRSGEWTALIVIVSVVAASIACYHYIIESRLIASHSHGLKFTIMLFTILLSGFVSYCLSHIIKAFISIALLALIVGGIAMLLWKLT